MVFPVSLFKVEQQRAEMGCRTPEKKKDQQGKGGHEDICHLFLAEHGIYEKSHAEDPGDQKETKADRECFYKATPKRMKV